MTTEAAVGSIESLRIVKEIVINAPLDVTFASLLEEVGPAGEGPPGKPMPMILEPFPGGRWYRDLGQDSGHLWGHVQVIKPPHLLELTGPMFMSYAVCNHIQYRLKDEAGSTRLILIHTAIGLISDEHRQGVAAGWEFVLKKIDEIASWRIQKKSNH